MQTPNSTAASRRSTVVSTPHGFEVRNPAGTLVKTVPFGDAQSAFDLARKLDTKAGVS
jgi:hypothetical protein